MNFNCSDHSLKKICFIKSKLHLYTVFLRLYTNTFERVVRDSTKAKKCDIVHTYFVSGEHSDKY